MFDLDVLLDDIEAIRRQFSLNDFVIVGHSGHAFLAIEYAKKYPRFVKGVVMTGCGPSNSDERLKASVEYFERTASTERIFEQSSHCPQYEQPKNLMRLF